MAYWQAPRITELGEGGMRVVLCALACGLAVVMAFGFGLGLRIRAMGRDWHRLGVPAGFALATTLAAQVWNRELAAWIVGMPIERVALGTDFAQVIALGAWFTTIFLIVNFPRRACAGLGFGETFSSAKRSLLRWAGGTAALVAAVVLFAPAPLAGYWHTPYSDCLCASKNLLVFENGRVFRWASGHGLVKEPYGTYRRHILWVTWDMGKEKVELRPGWFFMRFRTPDSGSGRQNHTTRGYREWRRDYIREVLATEPIMVNRPDQAGEK